jgi:opacity protein-like surface antigen
MKRISLPIIIIGLLLMNAATAQVTYGVRAGANFTKWQGQDLQIVEDLVEKTDGWLVIKGKTGFHLGGYVNIPISETFSFEPGLEYSKKGYSIKGDLKIDALKFLAVNAGAQVQQHYIDMPLYLKANVVKGLNVYAGPQVSYLVRSTLNAKVGVLGISLFNRGVGITERFNKVDLGLGAGVGYQFANGINLRAGYEHGLAKLDKNSNYDAYNRVVKVSVGYTF